MASITELQPDLVVASEDRVNLLLAVEVKWRSLGTSTVPKSV